MKEGNVLGSPRRIGIRDYKARDRERLTQLVKRINNNLEEDPIDGNQLSLTIDKLCGGPLITK